MTIPRLVNWFRVLPSEILEINEPERIKDLTPIVCDLKASMLNGDLIVRGDATLVIECNCDRCLKETEVDVQADDICAVIQNAPDKVDLTNDIREDILLAFPQIYLCKEDCKGLCFSCGVNLNDTECQCGEQEDDSSPWDALDKIKFEDN